MVPGEEEFLRSGEGGVEVATAVKLAADGVTTEATPTVEVARTFIAKISAS